MHNEGRYVIYNRAGEALVGRNREEIIGRTDREIFSPSEADRFAAQDAEVIRRDELLVLPAETVTRGDGDVRTILTKKLPITDVGDGPESATSSGFPRTSPNGKRWRRAWTIRSTTTR